MTIKIDNTKINGKILCRLVQPDWIAKIVFLGSLAFLINGDINKKPNVLGATNAGYCPLLHQVPLAGNRLIQGSTLITI